MYIAGKNTHNYKELDVGKVYTNNHGEQMTIICRHASDSQYYLAEFNESGNRQYINARQWLRSFDKSKPFLYDVGYFKCDGDPIMYFEETARYFYLCWTNMITRCYKKHERFKAWENVAVCEEWLDFTNFYRWAIQQPFKTGERIQLDKDLFSPRDHKIYSPDTCCFLPCDLNSQLISATYEELHDCIPTKRMRPVCETMSRKLIKYESILSNRVLDKLWKVCGVNGFPRERVILEDKCEALEKRCETAENRNKELLDKIQGYEKRDLDGKLIQEHLPLVPIRGYVQLNGKTYRIESGKDLYTMLNMVKDVIQYAPRP